jgi:hypothetical protein
MNIYILNLKPSSQTEKRNKEHRKKLKSEAKVTYFNPTTPIIT